MGTESVEIPQEINPEDLGLGIAMTHPETPENERPSNILQPYCKLTGTGRILEFMAKWPGKDFTRQEIADGTSLPSNSLDVYLSRLVTSGRIRRPMKGFYRYLDIDQVPLPTPEEEPLIHNFLICQGGGGWGPPPYTSNTQPNTRPQQPLPGQDLVPDQLEDYSAWETFLEGGGWAIKVQKDKPAQVVFAASKDPLTIDLLDKLLDAVRYRYGFRWDNWYIKRLELNRDFPRLKLEGMSALTLTDAMGVICRMYNKPRLGLRVEATVATTGVVALRDALAFVNGEGRAGELAQLKREITQMRSEITDARRESKYLSKAARRLLDEIQCTSFNEVVDAAVQKAVRKHMEAHK